MLEWEQRIASWSGGLNKPSDIAAADSAADLLTTAHAVIAMVLVAALVGVAYFWLAADSLGADPDVVAEAEATRSSLDLQLVLQRRTGCQEFLLHNPAKVGHYATQVISCVLGLIVSRISFAGLCDSGVRRKHW